MRESYVIGRYTPTPGCSGYFFSNRSSARGGIVMSRAIAVVIASVAVLAAAGVTSSAAQEAPGSSFVMADDGFGRRSGRTVLDDGFGWGAPKGPGGTHGAG